MRRSIAALAVLLITAVLAGLAPPASASASSSGSDPVTYVAPVSGRVTDPFRPPTTPYGPGNRGLAYETTPGSVARAAAAGRVTFAGQVGGALHVVVQHADGVRTSYSFLRSINVRVSQTVARGDALGTTGESFHFGARIGDAYIDPAILLASGPAQVHLVPDGEFADDADNDTERGEFDGPDGSADNPDGSADDAGWGSDNAGGTAGEAGGGSSDTEAAARNPGGAGDNAGEGTGHQSAAGAHKVQSVHYFVERGAHDDRRALRAVVADRFGSISGRALEWARARGGDVADAAGALTGGGIDLMQLAAGTASEEMRRWAEHLITVLDQVVNMGEFAGPFAAMAAAFADILQAFIEPCTPAGQAKPAEPGKGRIAVFVAGLGSNSTGPYDDENLSGAFHAERDLGYDAGDIYDYSYKGGRHPRAYSAKDTTGDLRTRASELRDLLDQIARDRPGVPVDVIAHSQGGLIAREALASDYDTDTHTLPPVAHLVTLGTPHHGADAATAMAWLKWSVGGRAIRRLARRMHTKVDLTGPGVAQLSETSDFIRELNDRSLRDGVAYTSIAAAEDITVPAVRARLAGASNVLVDSGNVVTSHSGLHDSPAAHRELTLALADQPPTCRAITTTAARAFTSAGIANAEDTAGWLGAGAASKAIP